MWSSAACALSAGAWVLHATLCRYLRGQFQPQLPPEAVSCTLGTRASCCFRYSVTSLPSPSCRVVTKFAASPSQGVIFAPCPLPCSKPRTYFGTEHPGVPALSLRGGSSDFCISSGVGGGTGRPFRNTSAIKKNTEIKTEELQQTHAISWVCGGRGGQVGGGHGCVRRGHGWRGVRGDTGGCEGDTGV